MKTKTKKNPPLPTTAINRPPGEPTHDEIALAAYAIWDQAGRAQGSAHEYWLRAETLLRQARQQRELRK